MAITDSDSLAASQYTPKDSSNANRISCKTAVQMRMRHNDTIIQHIFLKGVASSNKMMRDKPTFEIAYMMATYPWLNISVFEFGVIDLSWFLATNTVSTVPAIDTKQIDKNLQVKGGKATDVFCPYIRFRTAANDNRVYRLIGLQMNSAKIETNRFSGREWQHFVRGLPFNSTVIPRNDMWNGGSIFSFDQAWAIMGNGTLLEPKIYSNFIQGVDVNDVDKANLSLRYPFGNVALFVENDRNEYKTMPIYSQSEIIANFKG